MQIKIRNQLKNSSTNNLQHKNKCKMDKLHGTITTRVLETQVAVLLPLNQFDRNLKYELKKYQDFHGREISGLFIHYKPCVVLHTNL